MRNRMCVVLQVFFVLLTMLMCIAPGVIAQEVGTKVWETSYGDTVGDDKGFGVTIDSSGNILAAGEVYVNGSKTEAHMVRYNISGGQNGKIEDTGDNPVAGLDSFAAVAVDSSNRIFLTGRRTSANEFATWRYNDPNTLAFWEILSSGKQGRGYGVWAEESFIYSVGYVENVVGGATSADWAIVKYDMSATEQSGFPIYVTSPHDAGATDDRARGITVDSQGNIVVVGQVAMDSTLPALTYNHDWHLRSYTSTGADRADTTLAQGALSDVAYGVAVDSNDDIYVVGYENSGTDNGAGANFNWVVKKLKGSDLSQVWSTSYATTKNEMAFCVAVDEKNNIYVGGYSTDESDDTHWRLEYRSGGSGTLLKERTWDDLDNSAIRACSLRDNKLALTGEYSNGTDYWYTALYDVYTFPWVMFQAATSAGNGTR